MTYDIKELLNKIHNDGVVAAEKKAKDIEEKAEKKAHEIIQAAEHTATMMLTEATRASKATEEAARASLLQAFRDLLIQVRKEINELLEKIVRRQVSATLSAKELAALISSVIKSYTLSTDSSLIVTLSKEDAKKLEKAMLSALKNELKKDIVLKSSDDIRAGFTISYDTGKSHYDFTDKAITDYLMSRLTPTVAAILKATTEG
jgi:vacuolar-type H+-ATPase subunit E/Vma4